MIFVPVLGPVVRPLPVSANEMRPLTFPRSAPLLLRTGASGYVDMSDEASVSGAAGSMDVIIDTTPVSAEKTIATMM